MLIIPEKHENVLSSFNMAIYNSYITHLRDHHERANKTITEVKTSCKKQERIKLLCIFMIVSIELALKQLPEMAKTEDSFEEFSERMTFTFKKFDKAWNWIAKNN